MNEIDLLTMTGADVPPLPDASRHRIHALLLAKARATDSVPAVTFAPGTTRERRPVHTPGTSPSRHSPRRRLRAAVLAGTAAAIAAVTVPFAFSTPAFAVRKLPDGTVTVRINEFLEPKKLQASLRDAGIRAEVDYLPIGQTCRLPRGTRTAPIRLTAEQPADGGAAFRIPSGQVGPGQTLVLVATFAENNPSRSGSIAMSVIDGTASPCTATPDPAGAGTVTVAPIGPGHTPQGTPAGS
ncbi:hypothetical protein GCM10009677_00300 [Sphaerisporangium rubeum]|uniref:Uncharacterized protein n=1 Tax=Sphaerisporangium rubeum TaxID=321317 RepID=A0A7X0IF79_9ACTN|nr:hypothetical protein [Sphaerisporangium rubeum]MBB6472873.1 hypothetical protein [Sphaerisporangium rubeum]